MTRSLADLRGSTEPRVFTPPLRELTPQTSLGFMMTEFARDVVGVELLPYQKWLAVHALELAPGLTVDDLPSVPAHEPVLRFERVVVLISRQNGKTMFSQILALFFLYCMDIRLIIGTAQSLSLAQEVMDGVYGMIDENEHLHDPELKYIKGNTQKSVELPMLDAKYITKAMTGGAGRGRSADLLLLDELREQKDWTAWAAIEGTTQARSRALLWCMSNAGDVQSVVLRALRLQAHKELGDPDGIARDSDVSKLLDADMELGDLDSSSSRAALFEWSAPPKASKDDPEAWVAANPALNYTGLSTVKMAEKAADTSRPEWLFRTEYLCQWPDGALEGPFPPGAWDAGLWRPDDHEGEPVPEAVGVEKVGISMPPTRDVVHVVVAGRMADGRVLVQHVERRAGTEWVAEWLQHKIDAGLVDEIAGQTNRSAVSELLERLKAQNFPVVDWKGPDLTSGVGRFYDAVCENTFTHLQSDHLDIAAATAVKKTFESGAIVFDLKKSPVDAAPLEAAAAAHWLLTRPKVERRSFFEDNDLLVV